MFVITNVHKYEHFTATGELPGQ